MVVFLSTSSARPSCTVSRSTFFTRWMAVARQSTFRTLKFSVTFHESFPVRTIHLWLQDHCKSFIPCTSSFHRWFKYLLMYCTDWSVWPTPCSNRYETCARFISPLVADEHMTPWEWWEASYNIARFSSCTSSLSYCMAVVVLSKRSLHHSGCSALDPHSSCRLTSSHCSLTPSSSYQSISFQSPKAKQYPGSCVFFNKLHRLMLPRIIRSASASPRA